MIECHLTQVDGPAAAASSRLPRVMCRVDRAQADGDVQAAVCRIHESATAQRKVLESMNRDLAVELRQGNSYAGSAAAAYRNFTSKVSGVLAAAARETTPRRLSEFSTAELLEELRRRHSRD